MKETRARLLLAAALAFAGVPARALIEAPDVDLLRQQNAMKTEIESKVQRDILDPVLGKDRAKAFVDLELEFTSEREDKVKTGAGVAERYKEKPGPKSAGFAMDVLLPGVPAPKNINNPNAPLPKPAVSQGQFASQELQKKEQVFSLRTTVKSLLVTIVHDESALPEAKKKMVRDLVKGALTAYKAADDQIVFRPARFDSKARNWRDDVKDPAVYIPLLFAILLLLLLLFLFGPLRRFLRRYVEALREKPAAEVNVESKMEQPEEDRGAQESKLDIMLGRKPPEPPPPVEEEEGMKKFEPFSYINEENLKRLANLFMLRREEPWLVAVVLSYLKPEYARQVLALLPVGLQAKVAMEALMVRQVTREQVVAIDADIKENVDFVVGGIQRLTQMLEESDTQTRSNILEYLRNEKPVVYEKVRKLILTFEDVVHFPDREMQMIVRELKTESMARALQHASPDVVDKFVNNMSQGAASLLKESMEYAQGLTAPQIEEERGKIMDLVKAMEKEGKVVVRDLTREGGSETFQEELAIDREDRYAGGRKGSADAGAQQVPDPAAAQQFLQAGAQAMQAGQSDQAVQLFRQALDADPGQWQAYQYLGGLLYQMGRVPEAMIYYEKLLEYNQDPQLKAWVESYKVNSRVSS